MAVGRCLSYDLSDGAGELVGARSILETAVDTFQAVDHGVGIHALHQFANALQVAVAATHKVDIMECIVVGNIKLYHGTASAFGKISMMFHFLCK